jgi:hypothetical protein
MTVKHAIEEPQSKLKEQFVPFNEAQQLFELGFNEECMGAFFDNKEIPSMGYYREQDYVIYMDGRCLAPVWQQAFDFFRTKFGINAVIKPSFNCFNITDIMKYDEYEDENYDYDLKGFQHKDFTSYQEARLECLKKIIELIKEDGD